MNGNASNPFPTTPASLRPCHSEPLRLPVILTLHPSPTVILTLHEVKGKNLGGVRFFVEFLHFIQDKPQNSIWFPHTLKSISVRHPQTTNESNPREIPIFPPLSLEGRG